MLNLFIALIAFIALVWLAHYYLKIKNIYIKTIEKANKNKQLLIENLLQTQL